MFASTVSPTIQWYFDSSLHQFLSLSFSHFYKPLLRRGFSKLISQSAVFFLSAFFHEVSWSATTAPFAPRDTVCQIENSQPWLVFDAAQMFRSSLGSEHDWHVFVFLSLFCVSIWWVFLSGCSDCGLSQAWWLRWDTANITEELSTLHYL